MFSIKFVVSMSFLHKIYKNKKRERVLLCTFDDFIESFFNSSYCFLETKAIKCTSHEKMSLMNEIGTCKGEERKSRTLKKQARKIVFNHAFRTIVMSMP